MLTPSKYWRIACELDVEIEEPSSAFLLPDSLSNQSSPPAVGHGLAIAAYDQTEQVGMLRWIGTITGCAGAMRIVDWRPTSAQIWVDTYKGCSYWERGAFGFAQKKNANYGLHQLWQEHFDGLTLRELSEATTRPQSPARSSFTRISSERLNPIEVIGEPTTGDKAGVVYLLKSAYGYKVGRTRNVPARMRAFGVHLPFIYTIPLCSWFADCHAAERRYHEMFAGKRINGEWFDLDENDVQQIRQRA